MEHAERERLRQADYPDHRDYSKRRLPTHLATFRVHYCPEISDSAPNEMSCSHTFVFQEPIAPPFHYNITFHLT